MGLHHLSFKSGVYKLAFCLLFFLLSGFLTSGLGSCNVVNYNILRNRGWYNFLLAQTANAVKINHRERPIGQKQITLFQNAFSEFEQRLLFYFKLYLNYTFSSILEGEKTIWSEERSEYSSFLWGGGYLCVCVGGVFSLNLC